MKPEEVRLVVSLDRAQLDAGYDAHTLGASGIRRLGQTTNRVVIGERDRREADLASGADDVRRCARAIRRGGMRMQVDEGVDTDVSGRNQPLEK
jgi:hypothetical protein